MFNWFKREKEIQYIKCARCPSNFMKDLNRIFKGFNSSNSDNPVQIQKELLRIQKQVNQTCQDYHYFDSNVSLITEKGEE